VRYVFSKSVILIILIGLRREQQETRGYLLEKLDQSLFLVTKSLLFFDNFIFQSDFISAVYAMSLLTLYKF